MLQFWTDQGALLPEAEVQPEQQAEQRRMRSKIMRWAAKYPHHRDEQSLTDYMAKARAAAADSEWAEEPWRLALHNDRVMRRQRSPASLLQRVRAVKHQLAQHGISTSRSVSLQMGLTFDEAAGDRVVALLLALQRLPIRLDPARLMEKTPQLMGLDNVGAVLERRMAAMQQLHPQLDVARICNLQPNLLMITEETLAAHWASLQMASGLSDGDMTAAVQYNPSVLNLHVGVVAWRVRQVRAYDLARNPTAADRTPASGLARVLTAASFRVWRLRYLSEAKNFQYAAAGWVRMGEVDFAARNPGYSSWLAANPIPAAAYKD